MHNPHCNPEDHPDFINIERKPSVLLSSGLLRVSAVGAVLSIMWLIVAFSLNWLSF